ncbi:hypothetical protein HNR23_002305 [Nocardiopsis mwathae]|uniref:Uncharacterized protein n=1 Tax=Nocardiopsis mwathae TaxID=1472723 RepID=A0A7W9YHV1_9ACTN|nr:hypothetical protein [Nocardiopsis mwathae]MBB6172245.1 hypothetical protein [Nocardiopsis mwathae]
MGTLAPTSPAPVRAGHVYQCCDPRHPERAIRVIDYTPGSTRAVVVDAHTGKYPRRLLVADLHPTGTTHLGTPRRAGYRLISATEGDR